MSRDSALVNADWVEEHLSDPQVVLVEVDEDTTAYDKGHIQGAIKLDWTTDLQDQVRRDFVSKAQFEALLSGKGVANDDTVVLYGGNNNWFAAYAYWYFKLYGHQDVKLLDGGRKKWELDSRELTDEAVTARADLVHRAGAGLLDPRVPRRDRRRDRQARTSSTCAAPTSTPAGCSPRPTSRRSRPSAPATSRPRRTCRGARRPTTTAPSAADDELKQIYTDAGVDWGKDTIAYCRIGERSSPHLVRAARAARPAERQELRRLLDRVRLAGRRPGRPRRREGRVRR